MEEGVLIVDTLYVYFHFYSPYVCVRGWGGLTSRSGTLSVNLYREICWSVDSDYRIYAFRVHVYVFCYFLKVVNLKTCP